MDVRWATCADTGESGTLWGDIQTHGQLVPALHEPSFPLGPMRLGLGVGNPWIPGSRKIRLLVFRSEDPGTQSAATSVCEDLAARHAPEPAAP